MDVVLAALWQHFRRRQRWQAAEHFFRQLTRVYSPAALLVTAAARAQGISSMGHDSPGMLLSDLLLHHSSELLPPASLVGLGAELLQSGQPAEAAHLARQALQLNHRCRPAWLLLSQCFIAQHQYAAALVTLNVVPTPPLPAAEVELLHVVPPPPPKSTTHPLVSTAAQFIQVTIHMTGCCIQHENTVDTNWPCNHTGVLHLVPSDQLPCSTHLHQDQDCGLLAYVGLMSSISSWTV